MEFKKETTQVIPYKLDDGRDTIQGNIILPYRKVDHVVEIDGVLVLLLESRDLELAGRNIVAVDSSGREIWCIEDPKTRTPSDSFSGLGIENGDLIAHSWPGYFYKVDPKTGKTKLLYWSR